jgi:hypothetical protein
MTENAVGPLSFELEILERRVPLAKQFHIPPGTLLGDILGAVIGNVIPAIHRLNPGAPVTLKPRPPNLPTRLVFAVAALAWDDPESANLNQTNNGKDDYQNSEETAESKTRA